MNQAGAGWDTFQSVKNPFSNTPTLALRFPGPSVKAVREAAGTQKREGGRPRRKAVGVGLAEESQNSETEGTWWELPGKSLSRTSASSFWDPGLL